MSFDTSHIGAGHIMVGGFWAMEKVVHTGL